MAGEQKTRSVALAAEKARTLRMQRLKANLEQRLENAFWAVDALMAEAQEGELHDALWEQLHGAASRDGREAELADAYVRSVNGPRMRRLPVEAQAAVLMHAADYLQGVRGDANAADELLERVVRAVPGHAEAFSRLERRYEKALDNRRLVELYAIVAATPPRPADVLAAQVLLRVPPLTAKEPVSDEACMQLLALVPTNAKVLDALDAHCRVTKRVALACALIEQAVVDANESNAVDAARRHRLVELYFGDAGAPAKAIGHVETLLERNPGDDVAFKAAERLLSATEVASRAAAALQKARRARTA